MAKHPVRPAEGDGGPPDRADDQSRAADPYQETLDPATTPPRRAKLARPAPKPIPLPPDPADTAPDATLSVGVRPAGPDTITCGGDVPAVPAQVEIPGYEIEAQLGHGGMGVVFRARQIRLNRPVAIKMILGGAYASPEARVRFLTEAESIAKLHHPHIVQVYEFGQHDGYPYFTLEYLEGGTLEKQLRGTPMKPHRAARLIKQLARAVEHAHGHGIIHRDLKPSNILMDEEGVAKISDFGLAKQTEGGSGMTQSGSILGTPSYMAPEQAGGHVHQIGPHSDVYALGAILYEMLTGRPPFRGSSTVDTINQVLKQEPVPPRRLVASTPRDLETICLKCLQKDPKKRYASADDLADDLKRFLDGDPILARPIGRVQRGLRWAKRHPSAAALVAVTGLAAVALLCGGWWYSLRLNGALKTAEDRRKEAEAQRQEAEAQKKEVETQRSLVADNLQRRLDVVDDMLVNIDGRLAQKPGMTSVRMEFLNEFLKISKQLLAEQGDDPAVRRQAGRVYRSIGDLWLESANFRESAAAFAEAARLQQGLAEQFPENIVYQTDYATTCIRRSGVLASAGQYDLARECGVAAVGVMDRLVAQSPETLDFRQKAARYRYYLASDLESAKNTAEARTHYEEALRRQEELARQYPTVAENHRDLAATLTGLGLMLEATDRKAAQRHLERALQARREAWALRPRDATAREGWRDATADLYHFYRRHLLHAELAALAEAMSGLETYNAVCVLGYAAAVLGNDKALTAEQRAAALNAYAVRALELLHKAVEGGFTDRAHIATDPDLDPFRSRADFQEFMQQLATRFPNKPVTPAALFDALERMYAAQDADYKRLNTNAATVTQKKRARYVRPNFAEFGTRILALAEKNPQSPASLESLVWVLETSPTPTGPDSPVGKLLRQVMAVLKRDHLTKPDFVNACTVLSERVLPDGDLVLEAAQGAGSPQDVRAIATYALALSLLKQATRVESTDTAKAAELTSRAEAQLEAVLRDHEGVAFGGGTLGETARKKLVEVRTLSVGRVARDIEGNDLTGRPMKLSDFRGKVVLLDFWANWCGFCRQMYPYEKGLVERMKDRPFVLVGVNCDEDIGVAKQAVDRNKLNWRSWFDGSVVGGRATEKWQVDAYPSMVLLDENGVIRKKWVGKPDEAEVEAFIEQLLREMQRSKGKG